jgi:hypothetical protein
VSVLAWARSSSVRSKGGTRTGRERERREDRSATAALQPFFRPLLRLLDPTPQSPPLDQHLCSPPHQPPLVHELEPIRLRPNAAQVRLAPPLPLLVNRALPNSQQLLHPVPPTVARSDTDCTSPHHRNAPFLAIPLRFLPLSPTRGLSHSMTVDRQKAREDYPQSWEWLRRSSRKTSWRGWKARWRISV